MNFEKHGLSLVIDYDPESKHSNADGKYNARREVCEQSIPTLQRLLNKKIDALRDVSPAELKSVVNTFRSVKGETAAKYVSHVVYENDRVLKGFDALQHNDFDTFGRLMTYAGNSSIKLYGLSEDAPELCRYRNLFRSRIWIIREDCPHWNILTGSFRATNQEIGKLISEHLKETFR